MTEEYFLKGNEKLLFNCIYANNFVYMIIIFEHYIHAKMCKTWKYLAGVYSAHV